MWNDQNFHKNFLTYFQKRFKGLFHFRTDSCGIYCPECDKTWFKSFKDLKKQFEKKQDVVSILEYNCNCKVPIDYTSAFQEIHGLMKKLRGEVNN